MRSYSLRSYSAGGAVPPVRQALICIIAACLALGWAVPGSAGTESAVEQLKTSVDKILGVLKDPELKEKKEIRRDRLKEIAGERFDYRRMSQLSLARHWRERTQGEKETFTRLFRELLEDAYMSKIESYTDEKVLFVNERIKKRNSKEYAKINTRIVTQTTEIPIDYMMYRTDGRAWMVYDVVIEGVSMVNNYRSQFAQFLDGKSFESLVQRLKEKETGQ